MLLTEKKIVAYVMSNLHYNSMLMDCAHLPVLSVKLVAKSKLSNVGPLPHDIKGCAGYVKTNDVHISSSVVRPPWNHHRKREWNIC